MHAGLLLDVKSDSLLKNVAILFKFEFICVTISQEALNNAILVQESLCDP